MEPARGDTGIDGGEGKMLTGGYRGELIVRGLSKGETEELTFKI